MYDFFMKKIIVFVVLLFSLVLVSPAAADRIVGSAYCKTDNHSAKMSFIGKKLSRNSFKITTISYRISGDGSDNNIDVGTFIDPIKYYQSPDNVKSSSIISRRLKTNFVVPAKKAVVRVTFDFTASGDPKCESLVVFR